MGLDEHQADDRVKWRRVTKHPGAQKVKMDIKQSNNDKELGSETDYGSDKNDTDKQGRHEGGRK